MIRWPVLTWVLMVFVVGYSTPATGADAVAASIRQLRKGAVGGRRGADLTVLFGLRQLRDPALRPFFVKLINHDQWAVQVHAILGLAELDPLQRIDPWLIVQISPQARHQAIANAIDLELIDIEDMIALLDWPGLESSARLILLAELITNHQPVDHTELAILAEQDNTDLANLAALLMAQAGDGALWSAGRDRYPTLSDRERLSRLNWILEAIRQYHLTIAADWINELIESESLDEPILAAAIATLLQIDSHSGVIHWSRALGRANSESQRIRYALMLLASAEPIPASAYDKLHSKNILLNTIAEVGIALASEKNVTTSVNQLLDLNHTQTTSLIMPIVDRLPSEVSTPVYLHLIDRIIDADRPTQEQIALAVTAASVLIQFDPDPIIQRLGHVEDDSIAQETLLLGMFDGTISQVGRAAVSVKRIGSGRADSLALLLIARHAAPLDDADLRKLGVLAAGGGRVSSGTRAQAAWLYLKHRNMLDRALSELFHSEP